MFKTALITALAILLSTLAGCGTTVVSPLLAAKPGVVTTPGADGYPVVVSIAFDRAAVDKTRLAACLSRNVDSPEGLPIEDDRSVQVSGKASYMVAEGLGSRAWNIRYTLQAVPKPTGSVFQFSRIAYASTTGGPGMPLMASKWWNPELAYGALEEVVDRIVACAH